MTCRSATGGGSLAALLKPVVAGAGSGSVALRRRSCILPLSRKAATVATTREVRMAKPVDVKPDANNGKRELTSDELNAVTGGDAKPLPKSNVEKKWSQTLDGIAANMK